MKLQTSVIDYSIKLKESVTLLLLIIPRVYKYVPSLPGYFVLTCNSKSDLLSSKTRDNSSSTVPKKLK